jgi:acyl dehydratase
MKFADFFIGQIIEAGPYDVGEQEIVSFATVFDPQWFHVDSVAAERHRFGGLIASGWHTCSIAMRLIADAALHGSESYASPGVRYVKWLQPVRPDDALRLRAEVIQKRISRQRAALGILVWRWQLFNQSGAEVLDLETTSLFDLPHPIPEERDGE